MTSAAFIAAAREASRDPVLLMAVESVDTIRARCTTEADWTAAKTATNTSSANRPGSVVMATDGTEAESGYYTATEMITENPFFTGVVGETVYSVVRQSPDARCTGMTVHVTLQYYVSRQVRMTIGLQTSPDNSTWTNHAQYVVDGTWDGQTLQLPVTGLARGTNYVRVKFTCIYNSTFPFSYLTADVVRVDWQHYTWYLPTASLQTLSLDLGATPSGSTTFNVDDTVPIGTTLTYTARGSSNNSTWTNLGTVTDGASLTAYRYYDFTASFTSTGPNTPELKEISVSGGASSFRYFGTHRNIPAGTNAEPLLLASLGAVGSSVELMKLGSTGEAAPKLFYRQSTFELIRDNYLRNKAVILKMGFNTGMAESEFEPIFTGTWYDGSLNLTAQEISVKTRSILERFKKVKLPIELAENAARNNTTVVPITWTGVHLVDVCLDIIDRMGIAGRYVDSASFTALYATGGPLDHATNWDVTRTLDKDHKEDAVKLLEELSNLGGFFIIQSRDGKLRARYYDPTAAATLDLPARVGTFRTVQLGQSELYTRQQIYYGLNVDAAGTQAEDFANAYIYINAAAEIAWGLNADLPDTDPNYLENPGYMKEFFDLWGASQTAREALAVRMDGWYATPKMIMTADDLPPQFLADDNNDAVEPGTFVTVSGLQLPMSGEVWGTLCSDIKFMVTKASINPDKCTVSLTLLEV